MSSLDSRQNLKENPGGGKGNDMRAKGQKGKGAKQKGKRAKGQKGKRAKPQNIIFPCRSRYICWQHCTDINECGEEGKRVYTRPLTAERPILSLDHRNAFTHFLADRKYYYLHTTNISMFVVAQFSKNLC